MATNIPGNNLPETNPATSQTAGESAQTPPNVAPAETNIPTGIKDKRHSPRANTEIREWWKAIVETLTLIAVVWYACIASGQLDEMRKATDAATQGANAANSAAIEAKAQNTLLRQQTVGTFSAAVIATPFPATITDLGLLNYNGIGLDFRNIGKTTAKGFVADFEMDRQSIPSHKTIGIPQRKQLSKIQMRPWEQQGPPGTVADTAQLVFDTDRLTDRDILRLHNSMETIHMSGTFGYDNGFGDVVNQPFCWLYITTPPHIFQNGVGTGGGGFNGWVQCEDGKRLIKQAQKWNPN